MLETDPVESEVTRVETRRIVRLRPSLFIGVGLVVMLLGIVAMISAFAVTLATVILFGALFLATGIFLLVDAVTSRGIGGFRARFVIGLFYALIGGLLIFNPRGGAIGITLVIASLFFIAGLFRLLAASRFRAAGGNWLTITGVLDIVLAFLIILEWPASGLWVIGLFVGIELFVVGLALLLFGTAVRRVLDERRLS